jgi:homocysteine S-methyltransferase
MRRASARGKEAGVEEGILIAQEMLSNAYPRIQGVQVSAPFGKVPLALRVMEGLGARS